MKKIILIFLCLYAILITGCDHIGEIENNRVITACFAEKTSKDTIYSFYVSVPTGAEGGEDAGSKSSAKIYSFKASDFSEAIGLFKKSGVDKTDISHISLFVGNKNYFNNTFKDDEKHIRKTITATPLVYTCIFDGNTDDLIACINKEYNSKAEDFAKNIFSGKSSESSCMLSELVLSVNNTFYTSALPVIKVENKGKNKLPKIANTGFYSVETGINVIKEYEHKIYTKWRKKYNNVSGGYKININDKYFKVNLKDESIAKIAANMAENSIDILNVKYFSKKIFATHNKYNIFLNNCNFSKTVFKSDK